MLFYSIPKETAYLMRVAYTPSSAIFDQLPNDFPEDFVAEVEYTPDEEPQSCFDHPSELANASINIVSISFTEDDGSKDVTHVFDNIAYVEDDILNVCDFADYFDCDEI